MLITHDTAGSGLGSLPNCVYLQSHLGHYLDLRSLPAGILDKLVLGIQDRLDTSIRGNNSSNMMVSLPLMT